MKASTLDAAPRPLITGRGAVSNGETTMGSLFRADLLARAGQPDYFGWLDHIRAAGGCTRPVRLVGDLYTVHRHGDSATVVGSSSTGAMPDGTIYKACGNRRASLCPSCARTYQADAYQLLRAGLVGGKGIPDTVTAHPAVFATFTAPSFGPVHSRVVKRHTCANRRNCDCRPDPCHARTPKNLPPEQLLQDPETGSLPATCQHGAPVACFARHDNDDSRLGQPICLDCYDHEAQVVWNVFAGELWRRTKQAIDRHLNKLARRRGIRRVRVGTNPATGRAITVPPVQVSCGKVAEFQRRGVVHFHALMRLDGVDPTDPTAVVPPPDGFTVADLDDAIRAAAATIDVDTPPHPDQPDGWHITWGDPDKGIDVKAISIGNGEVTDGMAAGYLAKYATKSTEVTGHVSVRITADTLDHYADHEGDHTARLIAACWDLGRPTHTPEPLGDRPPRNGVTPGARAPWHCPTCNQVHPGNRPHREAVDDCADSHSALWPADTLSDVTADNTYSKLRRWAHMLGFGGHFMSKSRRYSTTFGELRATRTAYRRAELPDHPHGVQLGHDDQADEDTVLVIGALRFTGSGWHTSADALLANTAAAMARERAAIGREEIAHEVGSTPASSQPLEQP
ncbi:replication initiator [Catellatospora citrea]|uniref:Plasmid replication initiator protein n=1 Tax=Catellatospora citrea TaxID=53366 RepID=A0A8J3P4D1_9ACTN|nr:replication initiator [Catellatospora citrea]RKE08168.1 hypothetical protein C8E86_3012 [Catellatospora citrea]GIG03242.1 hypothetical protein Cci01nite_83350 [Catellatospora citrea]